MNDLVTFIVGIACYSMGVVTVFGFNSTIGDSYTAIAQCESTLPRNQTCKYIITAVPEVAE